MLQKQLRYHQLKITRENEQNYGECTLQYSKLHNKYFTNFN